MNNRDANVKVDDAGRTEVGQLDYAAPAPWAPAQEVSSGRGWGMLWRIVVYSSLLLIVYSLMFPTLQRSGGNAPVQCASNIHQLVGACYDYAVRHNGRLPPNLAAAQGNIPDRTFSNLLICPTTSTPYIYVCAGLTTDAPGGAVLIYEPIESHKDRAGRAVLVGFRNGSVLSYSEPYASKIIAALKANQNPLPEGTLP